MGWGGFLSLKIKVNLKCSKVLQLKTSLQLKLQNLNFMCLINIDPIFNANFHFMFFEDVDIICNLKNTRQDLLDFPSRVVSNTHNMFDFEDVENTNNIIFGNEPFF